MENFQDRRERTVYVSMMHRNVTDDQIYELFQNAGPIEKVIFKQNPDGSPQHALVVFRNMNSVHYAMSRLLGTRICGQPINIRPLRESSLHALYENDRTPMMDRFSSGHMPRRFGPFGQRNPNIERQWRPSHWGGMQRGFNRFNGRGNFGRMSGGREAFSGAFNCRFQQPQFDDQSLQWSPTPRWNDDFSNYQGYGIFCVRIQHVLEHWMAQSQEGKKNPRSFEANAFFGNDFKTARISAFGGRGSLHSTPSDDNIGSNFNSGSFKSLSDETFDTNKFVAGNMGSLLPPQSPWKGLSSPLLSKIGSGDMALWSFN